MAHDGALVLPLLASVDLRRHARVIAYLAITGIVFGVLVFAIDLQAGFPLHWVLCEGPPVVAIGATILFLLRKVRRKWDEPGSQSSC